MDNWGAVLPKTLNISSIIFVYIVYVFKLDKSVHL